MADEIADHSVTAPAQRDLDLPQRRALRDQIDLVERHDLDALGQRRVVGGELLADGLVGRDRIALLEQRGARVDEVHDHARALDVPQEAVAEPGSFAGALDQAGDVGDDEAALADLRHAEVREERGEGVFGDARARGRDAPQQRRLARVREADEADVGEQLQRQAQAPALARTPLAGELRRLARRCREAGVAPPAAAAARDHELLAVLGQIDERRRVG